MFSIASKINRPYIKYGVVTWFDDVISMITLYHYNGNTLILCETNFGYFIITNKDVIASEKPRAKLTPPALDIPQKARP